MAKMLSGVYKVDKGNVHEVAEQAVNDLEILKEEQDILEKELDGMDNPVCVGTFDTNSTEKDFEKAADVSCALQLLQAEESDEFILECNISQEALDKAKQLRKKAKW